MTKPDALAELKDLVKQLQRQMDNGVVQSETVGRIAAVVDSIDTPAEEPTEPKPEPEPKAAPQVSPRKS